MNGWILFFAWALSLVVFFSLAPTRYPRSSDTHFYAWLAIGCINLSITAYAFFLRHKQLKLFSLKKRSKMTITALIIGVTSLLINKGLRAKYPTKMSRRANARLIVSSMLFSALLGWACVLLFLYRVVTHVG